MEDTGHYHFNLLKYLLHNGYSLALINPTKTDKLVTLTICDILYQPKRKKIYRITKLDKFELYQQRQLTRSHHNLKEELNVLKNRLQKSIDYNVTYINILKTFSSASKIASADIRSINKCFETNKKGRPISLTAEKLKETTKNSIRYSTYADELEIKQLIAQIQSIDEQISEIDKKIEEFSVETNSPITSIPGISHFFGNSILAEIGNISNYNKASKLIKLVGVVPKTYESSQFSAQHPAITKKGSKYLRKTLYQVIVPVIENNGTFKACYQLKRIQGKSHRCTQGHCVRKFLRIIYHLL